MFAGQFMLNDSHLNPKAQDAIQDIRTQLTGLVTAEPQTAIQATPTAQQAPDLQQQASQQNGPSAEDAIRADLLHKVAMTGAMHQRAATYVLESLGNADIGKLERMERIYTEIENGTMVKPGHVPHHKRAEENQVTVA